MKHRRGSAEPWAPAPPIVSTLLAAFILAVGLMTTIWLPEIAQIVVLLLGALLAGLVRDHVRRRAGSRRGITTVPDLDEPDGFRFGILTALPGLAVTSAVTWAVGDAMYEIGAWVGVFVAVSFLVFEGIDHRRWSRWYESQRSSPRLGA